MSSDHTVKAVLLDLEGTLYVGDRWTPKALETISWLLDNGFHVRFVTNTTMDNRRHVRERFLTTHLSCPLEWFFTPARAAYGWFKTRDIQEGILPVVHPRLMEDLEGLLLTESEHADFVLVGDMDDHWNNKILNQALRALLNGATLTAFQKNRYWMAADGYRLNTGAFVSALEYGAKTNCDVIFGKPNKVFFDTILQDIGVHPSEAIMIGDDLESDVLGAQEVGLRSALVKTGKFRPSQLTGPIADKVSALEDISHLPSFLRGKGT